jgi:hypothetical protein
MSANCTICEKKDVDAFKKCFICSSKKICMSCYARFNKCSECFAGIEIEKARIIIQQQEKDRKKRSQDAINNESDAIVSTLKAKKQKEDQVTAESSNAQIEIRTEATGTAAENQGESAAEVVSSATAESSTTAAEEAAAAAVSAVSESASSLTSGDEAAAADKLAPPSTSTTAGDDAAVTSSSLGRQEQQQEEGLLHSKNRHSTLAIESPGNK